MRPACNATILTCRTLPLAVVNETAVNIHAFIYDGVIGVGLLVLVWAFLSWTYPPIEKVHVIEIFSAPKFHDLEISNLDVPLPR